jgi:glycerol-3-phosphate O-acyltransferase
LKLGLLQTTLDAQMANCKADRVSAKKIIIVPVVLSYQSVLEAPSLVRKFLNLRSRSIGSSWSLIKMIKSVYNVWRHASVVAVRFGDPLDVMGNHVDSLGVSYDGHGNEVDLYKSICVALSEGAMGAKKMEVGRLISKQYCDKQYVFSCYVVAFVAFVLIHRKYAETYGDKFWHRSDSCCIDYDDLKKGVSVLTKRILELHADGMFGLDEVLLNGDADAIVVDGVRTLGAYHLNKPLFIWNGSLICTEDLCVLYYYHNRLDGYGFEEYV